MKTLPALLILLSLPAGCLEWARVDRGLLDGTGDALALDGAAGDQAAASPTPDAADVGAELARADAAEVDPPVDGTSATDAPDAAPVADAGPTPVDAPTAADVPVAVDAGPADAPDAPPVDVAPVDVPPVCGPLEGLCGGACTALLLDPDHCGACGRRCPVGDHATPSCNGGRCELVCAPGFIDCGGGCQDARTDPQNCGACGRVCPTLDHALPACAAARCEMDCSTSGYADCDGVRANGCESAPSSDPMNCGECGRRCRDGQRCVLGACAG